MISKSRILQTDVGVYTDLGRNVTGSQSHHCSKTPLSWGTISAMHAYNMLHPTDYRAYSAYEGVEKFTSTEYERPQFNECTHTYKKLINHSFFTCYLGDWTEGPCIESFPYYGQYMLGRRFNFPSTSYCDENFLNDCAITSDHYGELANAQRNAWHAMQPRFEGQISLINALFELKDFRDILTRFYKLGNIRNLFFQLRSGVVRHKNLDLSKPAAGLFLTNELAIKPLLSDAAQIMMQISTIVDEAQQAFDIAGSENQKSHWSRMIWDDRNLSSVGTGAYYDVQEGIADQVTFTATMEYTYQYKMRGLLEAFRKYWGLDVNYEALWNVIPFSFVLDYFATLGKSIRNMEKDQNVNLAYSQYSESLLRTKFSGYNITSPSYPYEGHLAGVLKAYVDRGSSPPTSTSGVALIDNSYVPISGYQASNYRRRVVAPNKGAALPFLKLPDSRQGKIMMALARCFF